MTTWAEFRSSVWRDLADNPTTPRLSKETLWLYFKWACADYSVHNPMVVEKSIPFEGKISQPLPDDFVSVRSVQIPAGRYLQEAQHREGRRYRTIGSMQVRHGAYPTTYYAQQGRLFLNSETDLTAVLDYNAIHAIPATFEDDDFVLTIPIADERAIVLYIRAQYAGQIRSRTANLDRFKEKSEAGNTRLDNPMVPEHNTLMQEYHRFLYEKYSPGGAVLLYRPGKSS